MKHVDWIDRYKGLLIILVVMGHVVGGGYHLTQGASQQLLHYLYITIYSFHMPAFFFLAGITWRDRENETFGRFLLKKSKRLLIPYFIFGIASSVLFCLMSGSFGASVEQSATTSYYQGKYASSFLTCLWGLVHGGGFANGEGFRMNSVLWFLPCLFSTEMCYWWMRRLKLTGVRVVPVVLLCCALAILLPRFTPGLPWGLTKVPWYLLFLVLGAEVFPLQPHRFFAQRNVCVCLTSVVLVWGYVILCCLLPDPIVALRNWFFWPVYAALAAVGCVVFAWSAQVLRGHWWIACGGSSMGIMLMHKFPVVFLEMKIPCVRQIMGTGVLGGFLVSCLLVLVVTLLCWSLTRIVGRVVPWLLGER